MLPELQSRFLRIETLREELTAKVASRSAEDQRKAPKPGEWSPIQVLAHMVTAETEVGRQIASLQNVGEAERRRKPIANFGIASMCWAMRAAIQLPVPDGMNPPDEIGTLDEVSADWTVTRQTFRQRLESAEDGKPFSLHPLLGPITALDVLNVMEAHMIYHLKRFPVAV